MSETETRLHQPVDDRGQYPPGYEFNSELLDDDAGQIQSAWREYDYQHTPPPSTETVPTIDITPNFNPTEVPEEDVFVRAHDVIGDLGSHTLGPHRSLSGSTDPVVVWRIVDKKRLQDGSGITSSRVLSGEGITLIDKTDTRNHGASTHESRAEGRATPFVSFTTDPENFSKFIGRHQFGTRDDHDSVVISALVNPDRILSNGKNKEHEVLLLGGLSPDEYRAAYEVADFIAAMSQVQVSETSSEAASPIPQAETEFAHTLTHEFATSEDPLLPAGVLVHNLTFSHDSITGIAAGGILPHELTGHKNPSTGAAVPGAVYAYEVPGSMTLSEYGRFCGTNPPKVGFEALRSSLGQESTMFPGTVLRDGEVDPRKARNIAFIIDPSKVDSGARDPGYDGMQGRSAAFIGGIPRDAIAGIVAGADIVSDERLVQLIHANFPEVAIRDSRGSLVDSTYH